MKNVTEVPKPANNLFTFFLSLSNQFFNSFNLTSDIKNSHVFSDPCVHKEVSVKLSVESELKFGKCLFCKMHSIEVICHDTRKCSTSSKNNFSCCSRPDVKRDSAYSLYIYIG